MGGVPLDLPLDGFVGCSITSIRINMAIILLYFSHEERERLEEGLDIEGGWELKDGSNNVIDYDPLRSDRTEGGVCATRHEAYRLQRLFMKKVTRYSIDPPRSFTLYFEDDYKLTVYDDSEKYESFNVSGYTV